MRLAGALVTLAMLSACSGGDAPRRLPDAGARTPRKVKPPPDEVRVFPPHAIRSDGVGPYLLDAPLADVLHLLPEGPRVELLEIKNLVAWRVVRAEEGRLVIGADERSRVAFIAVLDPDVARTDSGLAVGATGAKLVEDLGAERTPNELSGRRTFEFDKLPNVTFVTDAPPDAAPDAARVAAVVVSRAPSLRPHAPVATSETCRAGGALAAVPAPELWSAAHPGRARPAGATPAPLVRFGCVTGAEPEAVLYAGDELAVVAGAPGKLKRVWVSSIGRVDSLRPLDVDGDGRDEIVGLAMSRGNDAVAATVRVWGWDGGRLAPRAVARPLVVTSGAASAAGASLAGIELYPEVWPAGDAVLVGGYYVARALTGARLVAPIEPVRVRVDGGAARPTPTGADAGVGGDAAPGPPSGKEPPR